MSYNFFIVIFISISFHLDFINAFDRSTSNEKPNPGWKQTDRFSAIRFQCTDNLNEESLSNSVISSKHEYFSRRLFTVAIRDFADSLSAFGWVQITNKGSEKGDLVGEFRGTRSSATLFREFLETGPEDAQKSIYSCQIEEYPDTRIRYHFSHFIILDDERITCFEHPPHQCKSEEELSKIDPRGMEL